MNSEGFEFLKYRPEFKDDIIELQSYLWSHDLQKNRDYFEWKHENNPYNEEPMIYICLDKGRVVGTTSFFGAKWQVGYPSKTFNIPMAGDSVIHPDYRNKGIFRKINELSIDDIHNRGYKYVFALSAAPVTYYSFLLLDWHSAGRIREARWQKIQANDTKARSLARKIPFFYKSYKFLKKALFSNDSSMDIIRKPLDDFDNKNSWLSHRVSKHISVHNKPYPKEMEALVKQNKRDGRIGHVRDSEYFSWRFQNPLSDYRFIYWKDASLDGYLVLQISTKYLSTIVHIVDWEATTPEVQDGLLKAALMLGNLKEIRVWTETGTEPTNNLLNMYGFAPQIDEKNPSLLIKYNQNNINQDKWILGDQQVTSLSNWDLRAIYSDYF
jgi:predicted N-acetyltransferase YhbS